MARKKSHWPLKRSQSQLLPTHLLRLGHWFYLCHAMLLLLLLYPYLEQPAEREIPWTLSLLNSIVVVTVVFAVSVNRRQLIFASVLGCTAMLLEWVPYSETTELMRYAMRTALYGYAIIMLIPYLLSHADEEDYNTDQIFAVISTYLLLGMLWTGLYMMVEWFYPSSFYVPPEYNHDGAFTWSDLLYFSFTTLTTLGYGNIAPVSSQARSLAVLEACTGVMFVGTMVARTISIYVARALYKK